jgi:glycosyltransferase involved in cell wall biosynthesis
MRIVMFTNTYLPHVGGVAQSVWRFVKGLRERGHDVLVVAPTYEEECEDNDVYRVRAMQNFNGSDFSVVMPASFKLRHRLDEFKPELVHTHHPFLLGDLALRVAAERQLPLVLTHHTMYEYYTHYVPVDLPRMADFVVKLSTHFAQSCDRVIAPSSSVADILADRSVTTPISVVPTGVDTANFGQGDPAQLRELLRLPEDARVIGHVGRLAAEKNLTFLALAVAEVLRDMPEAYFVVVGNGPHQARMRHTIRRKQVGRQLRFLGRRTGDELINAYNLFDAFAFSSYTETQGMVLVEALACGCPVVVLDAPGARDVVDDGANGRLVDETDVGAFAAALKETLTQPDDAREQMRRRATESATAFDTEACIDRLVEAYEQTLARHPRTRRADDPERHEILQVIKAEWDLWTERLGAFAKTVASTTAGERS